MTERIAGIHHLTAMAADPTRNLEFYTRVLGLRLVKRTINFDDPSMHHFYFGNRAGAPGTLLTFFVDPHAPHGAPGAGEVAAAAFAVPPNAVTAWAERLARHRVPTGPARERFGQRVLALRDPDGLAIELIETAAPAGVADGDLDPALAIRGLHSATLRVRGFARTEALLVETLGLTPDGEDAGRRRYRAASDAAGAVVDVVEAPESPRAGFGVGALHHIAWRTADDASLARWMQRIARRRGLHVTPVRDRLYFRSIYFRERDGVLHEIATDTPGFAVDEPPEHLGESLKLPDWLEAMRPRIERMLPTVPTPHAA